MKTYDITITRDGKWWMVRIPELDGLTQARRLGEAEQMGREWIAVTTGAQLSDVSVRVAELAVEDQDVLAAHNTVIELRSLIEAANERLASLTRTVARDLVAYSVPVRDVGEVLAVSAQRVSQLVNEATEKAHNDFASAELAAQRQLAAIDAKAQRQLAAIELKRELEAARRVLEGRREAMPAKKAAAKKAPVRKTAAKQTRSQPVASARRKAKVAPAAAARHSNMTPGRKAAAG